MQFEDFDNKVRQAADQHHPNYDENAWAKMQKMLDQHLPVKQDRDRRIIFLLLLFLLVGGGAWVVFSKPWQQQNKLVSASNNPDKATNTKSPAAAPKEVTTGVNAPGENTEPGEALSTQQERNSTPVNANVPGNKNELTATAPNTTQTEKDQRLNAVVTGKASTTSSKQNGLSQKKNNRKGQSASNVTDPPNTRHGNDGASKSAIVSVPNNGNPGNTNNSSAIAKTDKAQTQTTEPAASNVANSNAEEPKKATAAEPVATDKKDIAKKSPTAKKSSYLFFSFGVAPDLSYISLDEPGKVKLLTGAGFGYTFKNRWTIRTGFYAGSKIYTANKYNYKPDNPGPTANLEKIDADCKVYEVPLSIAYNFSKAEKHSFFASAGLSSYFMKREEYKYLYKYPGPPPTTYVHTKELYGENKHYFSVLTLSAGYGRSLNKTFSVSAEPYIKLPLAGIGYGHVKLNSMGVLFSVNVTPFHH